MPKSREELIEAVATAIAEKWRYTVFVGDDPVRSWKDVATIAVDTIQAITQTFECNVCSEAFDTKEELDFHHVWANGYGREYRDEDGLVIEEGTNRYRITELEVAEITLRKEYERAADDDDLAADEVKLTPGGLAICRWCRYRLRHMWVLDPIIYHPDGTQGTPFWDPGRCTVCGMRTYFDGPDR